MRSNIARTCDSSRVPVPAWPVAITPTRLAVRSHEPTDPARYPLFSDER
jgi:hypothetical protein